MRIKLVVATAAAVVLTAGTGAAAYAVVGQTTVSPTVTGNDLPIDDNHSSPPSTRTPQPGDDHGRAAEPGDDRGNDGAATAPARRSPATTAAPPRSRGRPGRGTGPTTRPRRRCPTTTAAGPARPLRRPPAAQGGAAAPADPADPADPAGAAGVVATTARVPTEPPRHPHREDMHASAG